MARRRLVTINPATGTVTTVKDLEDIVTYFSIQNTWVIEPAARHQSQATRGGRYRGSIVVGETHDNATLRWRLHVRGSSVNNALLQLEAALTQLEAPRRDLFIEYRPDGATNSVYYEVRGPATWSATPSAQQLTGSFSVDVDVSIPVGPLARGTQTTYTINSTTLPNVITLAGIPGDAPALADVILDHGNGTGAVPIFGLIAWTPTPGTPISGVAPWGVIEAETGGTLGGWSVTANASYRGGSGLRGTSSAGGGSFAASYTIDPSTLTADDFADGEVDVEVWGKFEFGGQSSMKAVVSLLPSIGSANGKFSYTEFGLPGKTLVQTTGFPFRFVKLGVLTMPVDKNTAVPYTLRVVINYGAGVAQPFGMDYLVLNPARSRALSPTGKPNDSAYPAFIVGNVATRKKIVGQDLSGYVGAGGSSTLGRDTGLGGSPIELPPGNVQMLLKLSSMVPDDPTLSSTSEQLAHTVSGQVNVWPRYWVAQGA